MEVKVCVDGFPRVVCGVTQETTCQDVVLALAQALGQPGRYTLREKFKDFERSMMPDEHLLETLERYGEQSKDVQLHLLYNGPSGWDDMSRAKVGRYQPCPPLRRKDVGARMRRGSGLSSLHRQSLPPLSSSRHEAEQRQEDLKRPKRKSLTLMEEAWEWLESLGKGKVYSTASEKDSGKTTDKKKRISLDVSLAVEKDNSGRYSRSKARGQRRVKADFDHQTSCCIGNQTRDQESKDSKTKLQLKSESHVPSSNTREEEKNRLRETIISQVVCLQELQTQIAQVDKKILELEGKTLAQKAEQEARDRWVEEETEQIQFWENELKAEEGYERDLQCQFLEMRAKALECKAKLEEYKDRIQGIDVFRGQNVTQEYSEMDSKVGGGTAAAAEISAIPTVDENLQQSDPEGNANVNREFLPREDFSPPHALVPPIQIKERRPTGPTELREWWTRWSEAQGSPSQTEKKVIHRSELTIYLGSAKV